MDGDSGIQLDVAGALRRRSTLIGTVAVTIFLATYWIAMALPNEYTAYATLLVEPQAVSERLVAAGVKDADLNERLHLMASEILSRPRLSRVIDDLGLYRSESRSMTRQEVIDLMREHVKVIPVLPELESQVRIRRGDVEINTFKIQFRSHDSAVAAEVAERLANDFIDEHISARVQVTRKSLAFISAEQQRLLSSIEETNQEVAQLKDDNSGRLPEDVESNQRILERAMMALREAQRQADVARSDAAFWAGQAVEAAAYGAPNDDTSPVRRSQLLELELNQLRSRKYTEKHPDVIAIGRELEALRKEIAATDGSDDKPLNLAERTALAEKNRASLRVESAEAELGRLQEAISESQAKLAQTPRVAERLDLLNRRLRDLSENLTDYNERQLEADVQANLERKQLGELFRIIEPAFEPTTPSAPNRLILLVMGVLGGIGLGGVAAVVAEAADASLHSARELQTAFGVPVLAAIPAIELEGDRIARRRQRLRLRVLAVGLVVFCLAGGALTYVAVNGSFFSSAAESDGDDRAARNKPQRTRG